MKNTLNLNSHDFYLCYDPRDRSIYWIKNSDLIIDALVYTNVQIFIYCANQWSRVKAKSSKDKTTARPIYDRRLLNSVARLGPIGRTRPANLFPMKQSHSLKLERCISFRDPSETQSYIHTYIYSRSTLQPCSLDDRREKPAARHSCKQTFQFRSSERFFPCLPDFVTNSVSERQTST